MIEVACGVSTTLSTSFGTGAGPTLTTPTTILAAATIAAPEAAKPPALWVPALLDPLEDLLDPSFLFCSSLRRFFFFSGDLFSLLEVGLSFISSRRRSSLSK